MKLSFFVWNYLVLSLLLLPQLSQGLSETELETLESSGTRAVSKSSWRTEFDVYLNRNLDVETEYRAIELEDPEGSIREASLLDPSNLYYGYNFRFYYSLESAEKYKNFSFLKQTELFLGSGFTSNFAGGDCAILADYINQEKGRITVGNYIRCGLTDIVGGFTSPLYITKDIFVFFSGSVFKIPLSKRSQLVSLRNSSSGSFSTLYFFKRDKNWSLALSSSHSLGYSYFKYLTVNKAGTSYNRPLNLSNGLSFIIKQKHSPYLPVNLRFSSSHQFAFNNYKVDSKDCDRKTLAFISCGSREHYLSFGLSSSWRFPQRVFFSLSVNWKDLILVSNPLDSDIFSTQNHSFGLHKWYLTTALSHSF